jgi:hypothetical protein
MGLSAQRAILGGTTGSRLRKPMGQTTGRGSLLMGIWSTNPGKPEVHHLHFVGVGLLETVLWL